MVRITTGDGCIVEAEGFTSDDGVLVLINAITKCQLECPRCDMPEQGKFDILYLPIRKVWIGIQNLRDGIG